MGQRQVEQVCAMRNMRVGVRYLPRGRFPARTVHVEDAERPRPPERVPIGVQLVQA